MTKMMMKCGHLSTGTSNEKPCCVVCAPTAEAFEVVQPPELKGRKAVCSCCGREKPSTTDLPFFGYCPDIAVDTYYCGCRGWD